MSLTKVTYSMIDGAVANVYDYGAVGDGVADDTAAIQAAITANPDTPIYFPPGIFKTTAAITISSSNSLLGAGQDASIILCDKNGGYAIEVAGGFYDKPVVFENLTLRCVDPVTKNTTGGVRVLVANTWGLELSVRNFTMQYFAGTCWNLTEAFNCNFYNVVTIGHTGYSTLLQFNPGATFANQFTAVNSVFFIGRIGVQNFGCASSTFIGCTFESLNLFLNVQSLPGYSIYMSFSDSWFESITAGIVNSKVTPGTETPIVPLENVQPIERIVFNNNYSSASVPSPFISSTVNPYKYRWFNVKNGYQPSLNFTPQYYNFQTTSAGASSLTTACDLSVLANPTGFGSRQYFTIKITALGTGGNEMHAVYSCSTVNATPVIVGAIYDPAGIGTSSKFALSWSSTNNLQVVTTAANLTLVNVDICTFGTLS